MVGATDRCEYLSEETIGGRSEAGFNIFRPSTKQPRKVKWRHLQLWWQHHKKVVTSSRQLGHRFEAFFLVVMDTSEDGGVLRFLGDVAFAEKKEANRGRHVWDGRHYDPRENNDHMLQRKQNQSFQKYNSTKSIISRVFLKVRIMHICNMLWADQVCLLSAL